MLLPPSELNIDIYIYIYIFKREHPTNGYAYIFFVNYYLYI